MTFAARLLLAVALLLPFRGAMAIAGILCHSAFEGRPVATAQHGHHDHAAHHGAHAHGDGVAAREASAGEAGDPSGLGTPLSSCSLCTSACSAPLLPSTEVVVHDLGLPGVAPSPARPSRYASAILGAIERPPRTF